MTKIFRISTIPLSLNILLKGQLRYLSSFYDVTAVSGAGKDLDLLEQRERVKTYEIEMERGISLVHDLMSLVQLYRYFSREKPDVIHSITPKAGLLSMIAGKWAGIPVRMHTFTGLIFPYRTGLLRHVLVYMDRVLCWHATHVYPEGEGVKQQLLQFEITKKPLKVLANGNVNGIDNAYFDPAAINIQNRTRTRLRAELAIPGNAFVFVFVGRLVRDKGINELVEAFKNISTGDTPDLANRAVHTPLKLLLVGPLETKTCKLLPETLFEIQDNPDIISAGFQEDVRRFYAISDALVFPSYREGFPNVVLQAGAMELPCIVTDINGCNEIIRNLENGLVIPPKDQKALAKAMVTLANDPALRLRLKKNTRSEIAEKYSQIKVWEALREEYDRLTNRATEILHEKHLK